jgi:hypothetical protein
VPSDVDLQLQAECFDPAVFVARLRERKSPVRPPLPTVPGDAPHALSRFPPAGTNIQMKLPCRSKRFKISSGVNLLN